MTVAIVDYGSGNLRSAAKALERAARSLDHGMDVRVTARPDDLRHAERIVLPGVGAFGDCRDGIDAIPGMMAALDEAVRRDAKPFLGICVGMQLMADSGHEHRVTQGFGWIPGAVRLIAPGTIRIEDSAYRLEHACGHPQPSPGRRPAARTGGPACLFRPFLWLRSRQHR